MREAVKRQITAKRAGLVIVFIAGLFAGWMLRFLLPEELPAMKKLEKHTGQFLFINPLLECESGEQYLSRGLKLFKGRVVELVDKKISEGKAEKIAVYFRDLNNGPFFQINRDEYFFPGSLLKIPILMGYLRQAEFNPLIFEKKIRFDGASFGVVQHIRPPEELMPGGSYSVRELLYRMIAYSDNYSARMLVESDAFDLRIKIYSDLGIALPEENAGMFTMNIKDDASFFRVLFNASYLSKDMSNSALELMSQSAFRDGLVKGVPANVTVSHKFGERDDGNVKQFHDCGIIYYPNYPYLLCVMTKGKDFDDLISVIEDVSKLTYEEVDSQMRLNPEPGK